MFLWLNTWSVSFRCYGMIIPPDLLPLISVLAHVHKVEREQQGLLKWKASWQLICQQISKLTTPVAENKQ